MGGEWEKWTQGTPRAWEGQSPLVPPNVCVCAHAHVRACMCALRSLYKTVCTGIGLCRSRLSSSALRLKAKKPRMSAPICTLLCKLVSIYDKNGTPRATVPLCSTQPEHPCTKAPCIELKQVDQLGGCRSGPGERWWWPTLGKSWGGSERWANSGYILKAGQQICWWLVLDARGNKRHSG